MRKLFTEWAMDLAEASKLRSTCLSRQVGAIIIKDKNLISQGFNGAPAGTIHCTDIGYCERKIRGFSSGQGLEYCRAGHAEANAITQCAKHGISCKGATLYATTQPCVFCSIAIIQSGIKKVVFKGNYPTGLGEQLFKEANILYVKYEDELQNEKKELELKMRKEIKRVKEFINTPKKY